MFGFKGFFLAFSALSLAEVMLFVAIGKSIGSFWTVVSVLATATIGVSVMRYQGFLTLGRIQTQMNHGKIPGKELVEGAFLMVSGALLLTPGFLTDGIGFALLVPVIRSFLAAGLLKQGLFQVLGTGQSAFYSPHYSASPVNSTKPRDDENVPDKGQSESQRLGELIEGEYERKDD